MKKQPKRIYAIINGDDNQPLDHVATLKAARALCSYYNQMAGYEPNCTVVTYERRD